MRKWKISEAKAKFAEMLTACEQYPQIICKRDKAVGVIVPIAFYEELMALKKKHKKPSMVELLEEIQVIKESEIAEIEIPQRQNRLDPFGDRTDEMAL